MHRYTRKIKEEKLYFVGIRLTFIGIVITQSIDSFILIGAINIPALRLVTYLCDNSSSRLNLFMLERTFFSIVAAR